jgi:hypothetical protein
MKKGLVKRILLALFWPSALVFELAWIMLVVGEAKENRRGTRAACTVAVDGVTEVSS